MGRDAARLAVDCPSNLCTTATPRFFLGTRSSAIRRVALLRKLSSSGHDLGQLFRRGSAFRALVDVERPLAPPGPPDAYPFPVQLGARIRSTLSYASVKRHRH